MKTVIRYDIIKFDQMELTPQGFLKIPVRANRTGIQIYRDAAGKTIREFRPPEEVFAKRAMDSLKHAPVTDGHPEFAVTPKNSKKLMVGFTGDRAVRVKDPDGSGIEFTETDVFITDAGMIQKVKDGKKAVSMGYAVESHDEQGQFLGERFDSIQRNIFHNHLAIVDTARGGPKVRLLMDSGDAIQVDDAERENNMKMKKIMVGDTEIEVPEEHADAIEAELKSGVDATDALALAQTKVDDLTAQADARHKEKETEEEAKKKKKQGKTDGSDAQQAKIDALESENTKLKEGRMDEKTVSALVHEQTRVRGIAAKVLSDEEFQKLGTAGNVEVMKKIIETDDKDVDLKDKSDEYIKGRFDFIAERVAKNAKSYEKIGSVLTTTTVADKDDEIPDVAKIRSESMIKDTNRWTEPVGRGQEQKTA